MPRILWERFPKLDKTLLELDYQNLSHQDIANKLNKEFPHIGVVFTDDQVRNRLRRVNRVQLKEIPEPTLTPKFNSYADVITGQVQAPAKIPFPDLSQGRIKVLHISDLHIPFQNDAVIEAAVQSNLSADVVIEGGDLNDCYALSSFEKHENVPMELEIEGILRHNEYMARVFPDVPIVQLSGNHHKRIRRNVQFPMSLAFLYDDDFYEALARPFPNIFTVDNWFYQLNDTLFTHDEQHSAVDGKSVVSAYSYFTEMREMLGLDDFRVVIQAHTHQVSVSYRYGRKLFEGGCCCVPMAYALASSKYKRPQANGWVTLIQENGRSILNECREHYYLAEAVKAAAS